MATRREFVQALPAAGAAFAVCGNMLFDEGQARAEAAAPLKGHFHPRGKAPSKFTLAVLAKAKANLPFADRKDFEEQKKGFLAPMKELQIKAEAGHVAWDMKRFQFLEQQDAFDSIHPSLLRQSVLNNNYGLYEVIPGIYQVRGFDLSDITFVRGKTGWIVFDPLVSAEPVRAAWDLFQQHVGKGLPVSAVIYSHTHADHWGNERIQEVLRAQRDLYAHMNNQALHLANQGVTINDIHNVYEVPKSLQAKWHCRGYHGSPEHNSRGVVQRYLGFWDCNPVTLIPRPQHESATLFVEMMGGTRKILTRGQELHDEGKYLLAQEIVNKLVQAEPDNREAKELLADIFEQIGYQQENPGLRNSFLAAAYELRSGVPQGETANSSSPDVVRAMSTELFLNFLGIRMDSRKAEGLRFTINLITPDNGEKFLIELENATLTNIKGFLAERPDLTLTINRSDLEQTMMGKKTLETQIKEGTARVKGDVSILKKLAATMVDFDPRFEIMPGTKARNAKVEKADAYEAVPRSTIAE